MTQHNDRALQYLAQQIQNATPAEQIVMLYDGAIKFLNQAKTAIQENDIQARYNANSRAADIIAYLWDILNLDEGGELAQRLQRIYGFLLQKSLEVDVKNSAAAVDDMISHLKPLRHSWAELAQSSAVAPKTQAVEETATESSAKRSATA